MELPACPVETTLMLIGDKWKVLILRDLMDGTKRFGELKKSIGHVTQKVLTAQLRDMEAKGLLTRKVYAEVPPRVEYTLTETGYSLKPILDSMVVGAQITSSRMPRRRNTLIREICKDETFLAQRAEAATADDLNTAQDLLDTLIAHKDGCVGMAANMIGVNKRIIVFDNEGEYMVMLNPVIVKKSGAYETAEGCLSLAGTRKTMRFQTIKVQWQNERFQTRLKTFTGWTAEIIQHEIDHCDGILI